jgi:hypothetical protein
MKLTKSELKEMIREALREELSLRENDNTALQQDTTAAIEAALDRALSRESRKTKARANGLADHRNPCNVLISVASGNNVWSTCSNWARKNNLQVVRIDCTTARDLSEDDIAARVKPGSIMFLDSFNRAHASTKAKLLTIMNERLCDQLFAIASCSDAKDYPLTPAELSRFTLNVIK